MPGVGAVPLAMQQARYKARVGLGIRDPGGHWDWLAAMCAALRAALRLARAVGIASIVFFATWPPLV